MRLNFTFCFNCTTKQLEEKQLTHQAQRSKVVISFDDSVRPYNLTKQPNDLLCRWACWVTKFSKLVIIIYCSLIEMLGISAFSITENYWQGRRHQDGGGENVVQATAAINSDPLIRNRLHYHKEVVSRQLNTNNMKSFVAIFTLGLLAVAFGLPQKKDIIEVKAPSRKVNCNCQCDNYQWTENLGYGKKKTHGNCERQSLFSLLFTASFLIYAQAPTKAQA